MKVRSIVALGVLSGTLFGQQSWVVKQEWVRAHEEFLASDALGGRGSATRDEEIAANYVASEFLGYGLKTAPGMTGYLQSAELDAPVLDGKAALTVGKVTLAEGAEMHLLSATGFDVRGVVKKVGAADLGASLKASGSVLLVTGLPVGTKAMQALRGLRGTGATAIVMVEDDSTRSYLAAMGGKARTSVTLKGSAPRGGANFVVVSRKAMDELVASGGETALLHEGLLETAPRKTFNAVGYLQGTDASAGTILLTAHLDHLGTKTGSGDAIFNGANDDAAGTTAVLELAHALANGPKLKRSVLFVCYGSEEIGGLGSTFFGNHPPVPLTSLVANLEFEMIGNQDPKMPKGTLLLTGWERSNLGPTLKEHGALLGPDPYPEEHFFERSDNYSLALMGVVAHTAAGWGTPPTYHQANDDLGHLDLGFMTAAIQSLVEPVRWLASSDFRPSWNASGQPKGRE